MSASSQPVEPVDDRISQSKVKAAGKGLYGFRNVEAVETDTAMLAIPAAKNALDFIMS